MKTVIKVCDETGNKHSGFELCNNENIVKLFPHGVYKDFEFQIGKFNYKVVDVYVYRFNNGHERRETIDGGCDDFGTHVWISCQTNDPRINEGNINENTINDLLRDLGIRI